MIIRERERRLLLSEGVFDWAKAGKERGKVIKDGKNFFFLSTDHI
jgi:hypothetical protein